MKETKEKDQKYFGRGSEPSDLEVVKAEGSFVYDANGKKYIDFLGGAGVGSLGWGNPKIEEAIRHKERPAPMSIPTSITKAGLNWPNYLPK